MSASALEMGCGRGLVKGHPLGSHPSLLDQSLWESEFISQLSGDSRTRSQPTVAQDCDPRLGPTSSSYLLW